MPAVDLLKLSFITFSVLFSLFDIITGGVPRITFILALPFLIMLKIINNGLTNFHESIIAFLAGLIIFLISYFLSMKRLGLADVWYSALIGLVMGLRYWYAVIGIACITGCIFIMMSKQRKIPFIPFMAMSSIIILMFFH